MSRETWRTQRSNPHEILNPHTLFKQRFREAPTVHSMRMLKPVKSSLAILPGKPVLFLQPTAYIGRFPTRMSD